MLIESRNNEKIKQVVKLQDRSYREQTGLFFFEGVHLLEEFLKNNHKPLSLFATQSAMNNYGPVINSSSCENIYMVTEEVFLKMSTEKAPQGIITVSEYLKNIIILKTDDDYNRFAENMKTGCLFLDSLQDNGNVGTILRTSAALGNSACVLSKDCADIYSYKTIRATMGALFSSKIYIALSLPDLISTFKRNSKRVFASALKENSLTLGEFNIDKTDSFVVGNEGKGISRLVLETCDETVKIPMTDAAESLNASAAATVLLWEMRKSN